MNGDLFSVADPAIVWDGLKGRARDGRAIEIQHSVLTQRFVAVIPLHGRDVATRRSCVDIEAARAAAEKVVEHG